MLCSRPMLSYGFCGLAQGSAVALDALSEIVFWMVGVVTSCFLLQAASKTIRQAAKILIVVFIGQISQMLLKKNHNLEQACCFFHTFPFVSVSFLMLTFGLKILSKRFSLYNCHRNFGTFKQTGISEGTPMLQRGRTFLFVGFRRPRWRIVLPAFIVCRLIVNLNQQAMHEEYPGFPYPANQIKKYFYNLNFFMLKLDDGELVPFTAEDKEGFLAWLRQNHIPDLRNEKH